MVRALEMNKSVAKYIEWINVVFLAVCKSQPGCIQLFFFIVRKKIIFFFFNFSSVTSIF